MAEETPQQPGPNDMAKMKSVADEGAKAAAAAETPEQATADAKAAMKAEATKQDFPISEKQIDQIAEAFVGKTIQAFEQRGAFDPAPEPVTPASTPAPAPPEPGAAPPPEHPEPAPQKESWAARFMGG